jgi:hypothetical protein
MSQNDRISMEPFCSDTTKLFENTATTRRLFTLVAFFSSMGQIIVTVPASATFFLGFLSTLFTTDTQVCGYELVNIHTFGDAHIYNNHFEQLGTTTF